MPSSSNSNSSFVLAPRKCFTFRRLAAPSRPLSNKLRTRVTRKATIADRNRVSATAPASTIFATSESTGVSGLPRLPGMVPVNLIISAMKRTIGALVVIAQQALSVQMIDQGDGSLRIPALSDLSGSSPRNLSDGRAVGHRQSLDFDPDFQLRRDKSAGQPAPGCLFDSLRSLRHSPCGGLP